MPAGQPRPAALGGSAAEAPGGPQCSPGQQTRGSSLWELDLREAPQGPGRILPARDEASCSWKPVPPLPCAAYSKKLHAAGPGWALGTPRGSDPEIPGYTGLASGLAERGAGGAWGGQGAAAGQGGDPGGRQEARLLLPAWWVQPGWGVLLGPSPAALKAEMLTRYLVWLVRFFSLAVVSGRNSTRIFSVSFWLSASQ